MRRAVLLGVPGTKRTVYLNHAAEQEGVPLAVLDWEGWQEHLPEGELFLKIDPPRWGSCCLKELERLTREYGQNLDRLSVLGRTGRITFLNDPAVIKALLDKRGCKRLLAKAGIPVTEEVAIGREADGGAESPFERLLESMERERVFQVFLKPNKGSGAAGVMALRYEPGRGQMVLYTCAAKDPETGRMVNTKRLRRFGDREEIGFMAGQILAGDCIVERWYPKAEMEGTPMICGQWSWPGSQRLSWPGFPKVPSPTCS